MIEFYSLVELLRCMLTIHVLFQTSLFEAIASLRKEERILYFDRLNIYLF